MCQCALGGRIRINVLALGVGYAVGKVIVGPALSALSRALAPAAQDELAAETAATAPAAAEAVPAGIEADPRGVYGYLPKPGSDYATFDFTNPEVVAKGRAERLEYLAGTAEIDETVATMRAGGKSSEEIARTTVEMRNQQKIAARANMKPEDVAKLEARNMKKYGHPVGPTADKLFEEAGSWEAVTEKSTRKDEAINWLLGIKK